MMFGCMEVGDVIDMTNCITVVSKVVNGLIHLGKKQAEKKKPGYKSLETLRHQGKGTDDCFNG